MTPFLSNCVNNAQFSQSTAFLPLSIFKSGKQPSHYKKHAGRCLVPIQLTSIHATHYIAFMQHMNFHTYIFISTLLNLSKNNWLRQCNRCISESDRSHVIHPPNQNGGLHGFCYVAQLIACTSKCLLATLSWTCFLGSPRNSLLVTPDTHSLSLSLSPPPLLHDISLSLHHLITHFMALCDHGESDACSYEPVNKSVVAPAGHLFWLRVWASAHHLNVFRLSSGR